MNTDNFLIEEEDLELAQNVCNAVKDDNLRNRAVANALAANIAKKFFTDYDGDIDTNSGLHNIGCMLENMDISDIYLKNNYIDVRVFFNENEICVPKSHFDNGLEPLAYMFIKLDEGLTGASVVGFILAENVDREVCKSGYYYIDPASLVSFYDIEPTLVSKEDSFAVENKDIFNYFDGCIEDQNAFYAALLSSKEAREKLANIDNARRTFAYVSVPQFSVAEVNNVEENEEKLIDDDSASFDLLNEENVEEDFLLEDESLDLVAEDDSDLSSDLTEVDVIEELSPVDVTEELSQEIQEDEIEEIQEIQEIANTVEVETLVQEDSEELTFDVEYNSLDGDTSVILDASDVYNTEEGLNAEIESEALLPEDYNDDEPVQDSENVEVLDELNSAEESLDIDTDDNSEVVENDELESLEEILENENDGIVAEDLDFVVQEDSYTEDSEQAFISSNIEQLYQKEDEELLNEEVTPNVNYRQPSSGGGVAKFISLLVLMAIIGGAGFYGYNKFFGGNNELPYPNDVNDAAMKPVVKEVAVEKKKDAMPIESVETTYNNKKNDDFGIADTIPAIEQNLDASILVSNLKADWEVPVTYTSSPFAKRYLTKLGKIIQLNLKTELLLLSKPPITNKITVEIQFNSKIKKFEAVGIVVSSGEKTVDNVILQTVQKALNMHLSSNMDLFAALKGNPVLVIRL